MAVFSFLVARMFAISNVIHGNGIVSAFEAAKLFTKPIIAGMSPVVVTPDILQAQK